MPHKQGFFSKFPGKFPDPRFSMRTTLLKYYDFLFRMDGLHSHLAAHLFISS